MSRSLASLIGFGEGVEATDSEVEFEERGEVVSDVEIVDVDKAADVDVDVDVTPTNESWALIVDWELFNWEKFPSRLLFGALKFVFFSLSLWAMFVFANATSLEFKLEDEVDDIWTGGR